MDGTDEPGADDAGAEVLDSRDEDLQQQILALTGGKGPDSVIEAVGLESHGAGGVMESVQEAVTTMERPYALNQAILACRPGGVLSLPGVFLGAVTVPMGAMVGKALTLRTGQTHVQKYLKPLLDLVEQGKIDPAFLIPHRLSLAEGPDAYDTFRDKKDGCIKVVLRPHG